VVDADSCVIPPITRRRIGRVLFWRRRGKLSLLTINGQDKRQKRAYQFSFFSESRNKSRNNVNGSTMDIVVCERGEPWNGMGGVEQFLRLRGKMKPRTEGGIQHSTW